MAPRFLTAFLRYEVGRGGLGVVAALRATATPRFCRWLLARPPRVPGERGFPPPARLRSLRIGFVSEAADRAIVSAAARRVGRPEQLSFLFERRRGRWLASGPGQ